MCKRQYPISISFFNKEIRPIIEGAYSRAGRPKKVDDYQVFCAVLYVLRTGIAWRDLPKCYGYWHTIYLRFNKGSKRGIWWKVLIALQKNEILFINIVMADSTTFKVHRHGGGPKGGSSAGGAAAPA